MNTESGTFGPADFDADAWDDTEILNVFNKSIKQHRRKNDQINGGVVRDSRRSVDTTAVTTAVTTTTDATGLEDAGKKRLRFEEQQSETSKTTADTTTTTTRGDSTSSSSSKFSDMLSSYATSKQAPVATVSEKTFLEQSSGPKQGGSASKKKSKTTNAANAQIGTASSTATVTPPNSAEDPYDLENTSEYRNFMATHANTQANAFGSYNQWVPVTTTNESTSSSIQQQQQHSNGHPFPGLPNPSMPNQHPEQSQQSQQYPAATTTPAATPALFASLQEEALTNMLTAWYQSGYATARYQTLLECGMLYGSGAGAGIGVSDGTQGVGAADVYGTENQQMQGQNQGGSS